MIATALPEFRLAGEGRGSGFCGGCALAGVL